MPRVEITLNDGSNKIVEFEDGFTDADVDEVASQLNSQLQPVQQPIKYEEGKPFEVKASKYNPMYEDIMTNDSLTREQKVQAIKERGEAERKQYDKELRNDLIKQYAGAALEIGSAAIPVGGSAKLASSAIKLIKPYVGKKIAQEVGTGLVSGALSGGVFGTGRGLIEDKNLIATGLQDAAIGGLSGGAIGGVVGKVGKNIAGNNLKKIDDLQKLRKAETKFYKNYLQETKVNRNDLGDINFTQAGLETVSKQPQAGRNFATLKNDIKTAKYLGSEKPNHDRIDNIVKFHRLEKDGQQFLIGETKDGNKYYMSKMIDGSEARPIRVGTEPSDNIITDVSENFNPSEKLVQNNITTKSSEQMGIRGGVQNIQKNFGDDIANSATDTTYAIRGREVNKAEFESLPIEQQQELINNADDLSDLATYAKAQHIRSEVENGKIPVTAINSWLKGGTEKAQALQAQQFLAPNTPEGALVSMQSEILKAQPKHVKKIVDNTNKIVNSLQGVDSVQADKLLQPYVTNRKVRKTMVDKIIDLQNKGNLNADSFYDLVSKKYNIPKITNDDYIKLEKLVSNIQNATTDREKIVAEQLLAKNIAQKLPVDWGKREQTYRTINMLLSPKSRSKDAFSTTLYQGERALDETFAMLPAKIRENLTGIKTRAGLQPKSWLKGVKKGFKEVNEDVKLGINTGRSGEGSRFDLTQFPQFENVPVLKDFEKWLNYSIKAIDRPFYEGAFESSLANQMKAQGLTEPTKEIIEQAVKEAKEAVFQGDSLANNISSSIRNTLDNATGALKLGQRTSPFVTTISNLTTEGVKSSPFGLFNPNLYKPSTTIGQMRDKDLLIGKMLKGASIYAPIGAYLANNPNETNIGELGSLNTIDDITGLPAQGVAIGNKAISLANMPQATIPISIYKALLSEGTPTNRISNSILQAGAAVTDLPAFKGIGDIIKGGADVARAMGKEDEQAISNATNNIAKQLLTNYISQEIPLGGALGNVRNVIDPKRRELMVEDLLPYVGNRITNRLPFASGILPQKYNVLGLDSKVTNIENPVARFLGETIDPINIRNFNNKPIEMQELDALTQYAKENGIDGASKLQLTMPKRNIEINGEKKLLDNETYSEYSQILNQMTYNKLSEFINSEDYAKLSDEKRINRIKDIKKFVKERVDYEVLGIAPKNTKHKTPGVLKKIKAIENKASKNFAKGLVYSD